jgi:hypothetical protein
VPDTESITKNVTELVHLGESKIDTFGSIFFSGVEVTIGRGRWHNSFAGNEIHSHGWLRDDNRGKLNEAQ